MVVFNLSTRIPKILCKRAKSPCTKQNAHAARVFSVYYMRMEYNEKEKNEIYIKTVHRKMVGRPRIGHLLAVQTAVLLHMDRRGDDVCSITAKELYTTAHLARSTFEQNFVNLDDALTATKRQIIQGIEAATKATKEPLSMRQGLFLAFRWLSARERRVPVELAVRRFGVEFWKEALHPFAPIMNRTFVHYAPATLQWKYEEFCSMFHQVLRAWLKDNMSADLLDTYQNYMLYFVSALDDRYITYTDECGKSRTVNNHKSAEYCLNQIEERKKNSSNNTPA